MTKPFVESGRNPSVANLLSMELLSIVALNMNVVTG